MLCTICENDTNKTLNEQMPGAIVAGAGRNMPICSRRCATRALKQLGQDRETKRNTIVFAAANS